MPNLINQPEIDTSSNSEIEEIIRKRIKLIGDEEFTLLGCPDDLIKDIKLFVLIERNREVDVLGNMLLDKRMNAWDATHEREGKLNNAMLELYNA